MRNEKEPIVHVRYKGFKTDDHLVSIDGKKLGLALAELGYPISTMRPLIVSGEIEPVHTLAQYNPFSRKVTLYQSGLINNTRRIYREFLGFLGEPLPESLVEKKDILQRIAESKISDRLDPSFWAYGMVKNRDKCFFEGNIERRRSYVRAASEGTLDTSKPLEEQRKRVKEYMEKLFELAFRHYVSKTLVHEYEHAKDGTYKIGVQAALVLAPTLIAATLFKLLSDNANILDHQFVETGQLILIGGGFCGSAYGFVKGASLNEQASFDAQRQGHLEHIKNSISVNHDIFVREIFGRAGENSRSKSLQKI